MGRWQQQAVCREVEKGVCVWGRAKCGWKHAMWALLREKENLALWAVWGGAAGMSLSSFVL